MASRRPIGHVDGPVLDLGDAVEAVVRVAVHVGRLDQLDIAAAQVYLPLSPSDAGRVFIASRDAVDANGSPLLYDLVRLLDARAQRASGEPTGFADTAVMDV